MSTAPAPTRVPGRRAPGPLGSGFWVKLLLVALVDALGVYGATVAAGAGQWAMLVVIVAGLVVVNVVYFSRRMLPGKYLVPGLVFLLIYQVFAVLYTGYTAFTNYGDGHNSTRQDAVEAILMQDEQRVPNSPSYPLTVVGNGDVLGFAVVGPDGGPAVGTAEEPLRDVPDASVDSGRVTAVPGWQTLSYADLLARQNDVLALRVPLSDDPNAGSLRTQDGSVAYVYQSDLTWDAATATITQTGTGKVFHADQSLGLFVADDGSTLSIGWRVPVGLANFTKVFADPSLRGPFLGVMGWTFIFAILSVLSTFALGLLFAVTLNHPGVRFRRVYRSLLIIPYAFPAFLTALVWQGMFNRDYGFINQAILGGAVIPWLSDPLLAKVAVLIVNLWLGFPYMFLICTGALQAVPSDVYESSKMDGASGFATFRTMTLPLLLVSTAPLLISSFAFNFNNFNVIYLLTGGGPDNLNAPVSVGHTDILISFVYRLAFGGTNRQYGFACAVSIMIFVVVATITAVMFRRTKALEEMM